MTHVSIQPEDVEIVDSKTTPALTRFYLEVPTGVFNQWRAAAKDASLPVNRYVALALALANNLQLVEGYSRLPNHGRTIDPILADAIRQAAVGQPWEHRAMLLVGTRALPSKNKPSMVSQTVKARLPHEVPDAANALFERHGCTTYHTVAFRPIVQIAGHDLRWRHAYAVLLLWEHSRGKWTEKTRPALAKFFEDETVPTLVSELAAAGLLETHTVSGPRTSTRSRLVDEVAEAIIDDDLVWF